MANFTDVFGVDTVPPSQYGYSFITLITNTEFNWPSSGTENLVSRIMDVSSASVGLSMVMPPANQVSPGEDLLIRNLGMNLFTVKDNSGTVIANVLPSAVVYLYVTDNTSAAGEWGNVAFGVGTSAIDAATLVGYGIKAIGNTLNQSHPILSTAAGVLIDDTYRAQLVNFSGGVATIDLSPAAVLGDDFFTIIRNSGTGTLTIDPYLAETIDGSGSFQMQPGESLILFCSGAAWFTVGYGRSVNYNFTQLVLDVSAGGTFVLSPSEASNKLLTFIGNPVADVEVIVPSVVAVYYILNSLSTPHSVTVKTAIGTGVSVPQGQRIVAISDGTNVYSAQSVAAGSNVSLLDGSVVNPALNFISQTNTGLYKFSTDGLGVAIVGADLAHFETTGTTLNGSSPLVTAKAGPTKLQQHTIPSVPSDTFALLAAPQTLTNKHIEAALNNIETAPSGNLTATELNAALAELEAEITAGSGNAVQKDSQTGSAFMPNGTTAQRSVAPALAYFRYNTTIGQWEWYDGAAWIGLATQTSPTGAIRVSVGTTVQRPPDAKGLFRYNDDLDVFEGFTEGIGWGQVGGGQMYGTASTKAIFYNSQFINENLTVLAGQNGGTFGPITVNNGFTVTVENGSVWSVV